MHFPVNNLKKIVITGGDGLLGQHVRSLLFAINAGAEFKGESALYEIRSAGRAAFNDDKTFSQLLGDVDVVIHLAGVNRGSDEEVRNGNQEIAERLVTHLKERAIKPHLIYANSTHSMGNSDYGLGKKNSSKILSQWANEANAPYTDIVFPHLFGEGGKPFYNTVTSTLCEQIVKGVSPEINPNGCVKLCHAGVAAELIRSYFENEVTGEIYPEGSELSVEELYRKLLSFYESYVSGLMPDMQDELSVQLFNVLRTHMFPDYYPHQLPQQKDSRGVLFEAVKGGSGQTFLSWTEPAVVRGNHFHRNKVERFLVVKGDAIIRVRHILKDTIHEYVVSGDQPAFVDMPTLHTHNIENVGDEPLLTLFWANEIFDPDSPDTYALDV